MRLDMDNVLKVGDMVNIVGFIYYSPMVIESIDWDNGISSCVYWNNVTGEFSKIDLSCQVLVKVGNGTDKSMD